MFVFVPIFSVEPNVSLNIIPSGNKLIVDHKFIFAYSFSDQPLLITEYKDGGSADCICLQSPDIFKIKWNLRCKNLLFRSKEGCLVRLAAKKFLNINGGDTKLSDTCRTEDKVRFHKSGMISTSKSNTSCLQKSSDKLIQRSSKSSPCLDFTFNTSKMLSNNYFF